MIQRLSIWILLYFPLIELGAGFALGIIIHSDKSATAYFQTKNICASILWEC
jgi:hypothetical protein